MLTVILCVVFAMAMVFWAVGIAGGFANPKVRDYAAFAAVLILGIMVFVLGFGGTQWLTRP